MKGLTVVSASMGCAALWIAGAYIGPEEWVRRPLPEGQMSLVQTVENIAPVWPFLFGFAGFALLWTTVIRRGVVATHALAATLWMFYGLLLLLSSLLSEPPAPILTGGISVWAAVMHFGCAVSWSERGFR